MRIRGVIAIQLNFHCEGTLVVIVDISFGLRKRLNYTGQSEGRFKLKKGHLLMIYF